MTRLLLIGLLTVLSFSSFATSPIDEQPIKPWVEPKIGDSLVTYYCRTQDGRQGQFGLPTQNVDTLESCFSKIQALVDYQCSQPQTSGYHSCSNFRQTSTGVAPDINYYLTFSYCYSPTYCGNKSASYGPVNSPKQSPGAKECPPDDFPDYIIGPAPESEQNPTHEVCKPKFTPCPLGFFKNEVTLSTGESKCVPVTCPDKGTRVNNVFNKNGVIGVGSAGTYCDGKCSYTIQPTDAPYNGSSFVYGTSNGAVCGQGDDANIKFTPTDKEGTCTTTQLSTGANFQTCTEGDATAPEEDNAEGELDDKAQDAAVDPITKPTPYDGADCSVTEDKLFCVGTEIIKALDHQTSETKKQQDEKHNKLVELQKDISEYVENQQRERSNLQSTQSQNETSLILGGLTEITTAIKAGSSGGGDGDGESLTEQFDGDSILAQFSSFLDGKNQDIDNANSNLDSALDEGISKFGETDAIWNPFKDIPTYLPTEYTCQPFTLGLDEHPLILDLCEYEDLIKSVIGFVFIMLTAMRLFYQAQIIVRNSAIGSAQRLGMSLSGSAIYGRPDRDVP